LPLLAVAGDYIDSLRTAIHSAPDSCRVKLFMQLADSLEYTDPAEAEKNFLFAKKLAGTLHDRRLQAKIAQRMGVFFWEKGAYEKAMEVDKEALDLFKSFNDASGVASSHMAIGVNLSDLNMQEMAVEELLQAMRIYEELKDKNSLSSVYNNLAAIYSEMGDNMQALSYLYKAKGLLEKGDNSVELADIYQNIGSILSENGEDEKAIAFYSRALEIYEKQGYENGKVLCLANAAESYHKLKYDVKAEHFLREAISISRQIGDLPNLVYSLNMLSEFLVAKIQYKEANSLLDESAEICIQNHYGWELSENLKIRARLLEKEGKSYEAYHTIEAYIQLKDSLENGNRLSQIQNMIFVMERDRFDREKERNYALAEKERLLTQRNKTIYFAGGLIILLLGGLLFSSYRANRIKTRTANLLLQKQKLLQEANSRLELEKGESERAMKAKSDFLSMITHELRTPMNAVIGISNMLEESNEDPSKKKHLSTLRYSSRNLLNLINGILDYNKLDSSETYLEEVDFDLLNLLENSKTALNIEASNKGINLQFIHGTDVNTHLIGDPTRINQLINNLVSNAIKFTDKGFVWLYVENTAKNEQGESKIRFTVKDTGIGISKENIQRIFEPFQQADLSINRKFGGTGLGLAISKKIVQAMGAEFQISSEPGLGTSISFELALKYSDSKNLKNEFQIHNAEEILKYLKGRKIMVVDDNEINLFVARSILEKNEVKAVVCSSGMEAIKLMESGDIDLVLMDLQMPLMDGFETTCKIRDLKYHAPIVALTAGDREELRFGKQHDLFSGFLRKPYETSELFQVIYRALRDQELQSAG